MPAVDADLNPVSLRITYEVDQGSERLLGGYGADAQARLSDGSRGGRLGGRADRNDAGAHTSCTAPTPRCA
jgi:hypothetical protein